MTKRIPLGPATTALHLLRQGWTLLSPESYEILGAPAKKVLVLRTAADNLDGMWPMTADGCTAALRDAESHDQKVLSARIEAMRNGAKFPPGGEEDSAADG